MDRPTFLFKQIKGKRKKSLLLASSFYFTCKTERAARCLRTAILADFHNGLNEKEKKARKLIASLFKKAYYPPILSLFERGGRQCPRTWVVSYNWPSVRSIFSSSRSKLKTGASGGCNHFPPVGSPFAHFRLVLIGERLGRHQRRGNEKQLACCARQPPPPRPHPNLLLSL